MARAKKGPDRYVVAEGLIETREAGFDRPVFRRPGFDGLVNFDRMEWYSAQIRARRERGGLTRETLALMLRLSTQTWRYEVAFSNMHLTPLIHLCFDTLLCVLVQEKRRVRANT